MARIAEKNPRFRSKEVLCSDLSKVLNSDLHFGTKMGVLNEIFWIWTEFEGKIIGCPYWSNEAKKAYTLDKKVKLIHEHLMPREIIRKMVFDLDQPTAEDLMNLFSKNLIGVVVTKEEDNRLNDLGLRSKMLDDWDGVDPWARHEKANIVSNQVP